MEEIGRYYKRFKFGEDNFHRLMKRRIRTILLVSSFYDAFIFEEDGRLSEQVFGEYRQLNLSTAPRIISVPTGEDALRILDKYNFDLVITMKRIGSLTPGEFAHRIKEHLPEIPVLLLLNVNNDIPAIDKNSAEMEYIDDVFSWTGDTTLLLAMVKQVEDQWNVAIDTEIGLVRVIILVEDSIEYYSKFLPVLYQEIMKQTQLLINSELDDINKRLQMRARPKVLLCHDYETAVKNYEKYEEFVIAVISDIRFPRAGKQDESAGIDLTDYVKRRNSTLPILLNSSEAANRQIVEKLGVEFLSKNSKKKLEEIKSFIVNNLGFGEFIFRNEEGKIYGRASDINTFARLLNQIGDESLLYHSIHNHYSAWLAAHGEFLVAKRIRHWGVDDFGSCAEIRQFLVNTFQEVKEIRLRGKMVQFDPQYLDMDDVVIRLADGSLGGKGRGLAFLNALMVSMDWGEDSKQIKVRIPRTFIIGTNEYDDFIEHNRIEKKVLEKSDTEIKDIFLQSSFSKELIERLKLLLQKIDYPLAVRSSGLLEDSQSQPFAGVYGTYMLPNNHPDFKVRMRQLLNAVKLVYASIYRHNARNYIEGFNFRVEEEKMAVIIQQIAGSQQGSYFYPQISGVAQSYNYYPVYRMKHEDGVASIVTGMGEAVVNGLQTYKFSPAYPKMNILKPAEQIERSQQDLYAINLSHADFDLRKGELETFSVLPVREIMDHNCLKYVTSFWDHYQQKYVDGKFEKGTRIVTFDNILKYGDFPFAAVLKRILDVGTAALGVPVEIEFAVDLSGLERNELSYFYVLQIRPMTVNQELLVLKEETIDKSKAILFSNKALGNGLDKDIFDIIYVLPEIFSSTITNNIVPEIEAFNLELRQAGKKYLLLGPGRWGTSDRFLGIPVRWDQINAAKVIVEISLNDYQVDFSQGTHFFHNLIAQNTGYIFLDKEGILDLDWLNRQEVISRSKYVVHLRSQKPLQIEISGMTGLAVIYRDAEET
ncbi:MAG: hypothetical protein K9N06_12045 [Candidatus Cloacimonetes bacterium]|nr:hypothetical protein [Candidatus Cloacimonadota bacterium]